LKKRKPAPASTGRGFLIGVVAGVSAAVVLAAAGIGAFIVFSRPKPEATVAQTPPPPEKPPAVEPAKKETPRKVEPAPNPNPNPNPNPPPPPDPVLPAPPPPGDEVPAKNPEAEPKILATELFRSQAVGGNGGEPFEHREGENALLSGFVVKTRFEGNRTEIAYLQPIYWTPKGRKMYGSAAGRAKDTRSVPDVEAKEGYAIGGIMILCDPAGFKNVRGLRIQFMRRIDARTLDQKDSYWTEWIGLNGEGRGQMLAGDGKPIAGIHGRAGGGIDCLGVIQVRVKKQRQTNPLDNLNAATLTPILRKTYPPEVVAVVTAPNEIVDCSFTPDCALLAVVEKGGPIRLWQIKGPAPQAHAVLAEKQPALLARFLPDGKHLVSIHADNTVQRWKLTADGAQKEATTQIDGLRPGPIGVHPTRAQITVSAGTASAFLDLSGAEIVNRGAFGGAVLSYAFSPDGKMFASVFFEPRRNGNQYGSAIKFWMVSDAQPVDFDVLQQEQSIKAVAWSPDGKLLATGGRDNQVRLWNMDEQGKVKGMNSQFAVPKIPRSLHFTRDSATIVAFCSGDEIVHWDIASQKPVKTWKVVSPVSGPMSRLLSVHTGARRQACRLQHARPATGDSSTADQALNAAVSRTFHAAITPGEALKGRGLGIIFQ
jgi:hypothetical protein